MLRYAWPKVGVLESASMVQCARLIGKMLAQVKCEVRHNTYFCGRGKALEELSSADW
jgi:hypothetical protein